MQRPFGILEHLLRDAVRTLTVGAAVLTLAGCSSPPVFPSAASATKYWDSHIEKLAHGVMARDDGRGCAKTAPGRFSCAGYLRNAQNSLSTGRNVIGELIVNGGNIHVAAHPASSRAMDRWLARYRTN